MSTRTTARLGNPYPIEWFKVGARCDTLSILPISSISGLSRPHGAPDTQESFGCGRISGEPVTHPHTHTTLRPLYWVVMCCHVRSMLVVQFCSGAESNMRLAVRFHSHQASFFRRQFLGSANIPPALAEPAAWEPNLASPQPPAAPITGRFWQATLRPPQVGDQR